MKYFIDTEFIEGFPKSKWPFFKKRHFIDLISIGIVAEDGRTFYAISNEYNYNDADEWVKKNVIAPMVYSNSSWRQTDKRNRYDVHNFHKFYGLENKQIADGIKDFCMGGVIGIDANAPNNIWSGGQLLTRTEPEFYGYYADYDWVLFCSLFGRMIDLPKGFPMYCKDLKQTLDETAYSRKIQGRWVGRDSNESKLDYEIRNLKAHPNYPKQENEHNALSDAKWNYELYKFINS